MNKLDQSSADAQAMKSVLWPGNQPFPITPSSQQAVLLSMNAPGKRPRPGSLRSDHVDMDSYWHFHDMHQLFFAFEGSAEVVSEGGSHLVTRQLAVWIPAGMPHRTHLHRVRSGSIFFPARMVLLPGQRIRSVVVTPLMREMMQEAGRWPLQAPYTHIRKVFFEATAALCAEWIKEEAELFLPTGNDARLKRALGYTAHRLDAKLADVCSFAGMSERSLRRHLKAETGLTWETYRQRSRLLRAIALLSETDEPITNIAARCGFESPSAFAKVFRAAMNELPKDYRNRHGAR